MESQGRSRPVLIITAAAVTVLVLFLLSWIAVTQLSTRDQGASEGNSSENPGVQATRQQTRPAAVDATPTLAADRPADSSEASVQAGLAGAAAATGTANNGP